jgi:hypothetical protein
MEKNKKILPFSSLYFILLLGLGLVIIFESIFIVNSLSAIGKKTRLSTTGKPPTPLSPQTEIKEGVIKITLKENQKIVPNKDIDAIISFNSPKEAIAGVDVILNFDPKLISFENISENKKIFDQIIVNTQKQKEGRIKITAYQPKSILKGEQVLANLTFKLLEKNQAGIKIEFLGPDVVTDSNLVSQANQKDILGKVESLILIPEQ